MNYCAGMKNTKKSALREAGRINASMKRRKIKGEAVVLTTNKTQRAQTGKKFKIVVRDQWLDELKKSPRRVRR